MRVYASDIYVVYGCLFVCLRDDDAIVDAERYVDERERCRADNRAPCIVVVAYES